MFDSATMTYLDQAGGLCFGAVFSGPDLRAVILQACNLVVIALLALTGSVVSFPESTKERWLAELSAVES
jgi:hypothetical protein